MPYQKSIYDNRAIADFPREAIDNIESGIHTLFHTACVAACVQHMEILGDVAGFWPFFEGRLDIVQDFSPNAYHLFSVWDLDEWDTLPQNQGVMRTYVFGGIWDFLYGFDADEFTVAAQEVFSVGVWVNMADSAANAILTKWDETIEEPWREWKLCLDATGYPGLTIYDEANDAAIGREDQTALSERVWHYIVATYHGGTDADEIKVYVDGVQADDADIVDDLAFASMVNTDATVLCGVYINDEMSPADMFKGAMWGPFFTRKELTADEVWNLYQLGRAVLDLDLIAGMPD